MHCAATSCGFGARCHYALATSGLWQRPAEQQHRRRIAGHRRVGRTAADAAGCEGDAQLRHAVDTALRAEQFTVRTDLASGCAISSVDTVRLGANAPCEDNMSVMRCANVDSHMLGVFDGHGGPHCSEYIAATLFDYVRAAALPRHNINPRSAPCDESRWLLPPAAALGDRLAPAHRDNLARFKVRLQEEMNWITQGTVRMALQHAFVTLDGDVLRAAAGAHSAAESAAGRQQLHAAVSGSTACVAHVRRNNLHIANAGDSRAVLGVSNASGGWSARRLSLMHCVDNAAEVQRIRGAHPVGEHDAVLRGGRLLGQLFPLRAFGDCAYKWPRRLQESALHALYGASVTPALLHTPPYLTAQPEVYYHRLTANDRFLVLATDGLWDFLSPESVVRLLADHTAGRQTLQSVTVSQGAGVSAVLAELRRRAEGNARPPPIDHNAATHLARHALAGGTDAKAYRRLADLLSMRADQARVHRDDMAIMVVYFDHEYLTQDFPPVKGLSAGFVA